MHKTMDETLSRPAALRRADEAPLAPRMADFDGHNAFASDPVLTASLEGALQEEAEEELRALGMAYGASFVGGILSILALILMSRRAQVPAALMTPFNRGER